VLTVTAEMPQAKATHRPAHSRYDDEMPSSEHWAVSSVAACSEEWMESIALFLRPS
jgi:hypothetical protein